jgi:hypothetical protein
MEDKLDLISHLVYSTETEDVVSEPNLTADNTDYVCVKLEMPDDSNISTGGFPHNVMAASVESVFVRSEMPDDSVMSTSQFPHNLAESQDSTVKTEVIVHQNPDWHNDDTHDDVQHSAECHTFCFKHEYKHEEDSTPVVAMNVDAGTSVVVKSEVPDDSRVPTTQFPHNITDIQDCKVKTEVIVRQNPDCVDAITHDDVHHSAESNIICFKHEYKKEDDRYGADCRGNRVHYWYRQTTQV